MKRPVFQVVFWVVLFALMAPAAALRPADAASHGVTTEGAAAVIAAGEDGEPADTAASVGSSVSDAPGIPPMATLGRLGNAAELEAFVDGVMAAHLSDHNVAGATVSVVRDGQMVLSKGYGYSDPANAQPVDPATTLFRIGSVSKAFTWVAVLQLRDQGLLDLDTDINEYLQFRIPEAFDAPITLRHILTHTPGFEDRLFGIFGRENGGQREEWLSENIPARVLPPGHQPAYSNYAAALAGHIVEQVSGMSWEDYVEERILAPLGMEYATTREPPPERLAPHMSGGFAWEDGQFVEKPFEHIGPLAPAGAMSASAEAMAPFMLALLQEGRSGDSRILAPESAQEMLQRAFAADSRVNGLTLGLYESGVHGVRVVGHGGGTQWFFTDMALFPEEGMGVFISYNSAGGMNPAMGNFMGALFDRFYPVAPYSLEEVPQAWEERAADYRGSYRMLRRPHTTFEKLLGVVMQIGVEPLEPGVIMVSSGMMGEQRMLQVEPGLFQTRDRKAMVAFGTDDRTGRQLLVHSQFPPSPAEQARPLESASLHLFLFLFWMLLFISILIVMPVRYLLQRRFAEVGRLAGAERWLRWAALAVAVLCLGFLVAFSRALSNLEDFMSGAAEGSLRAALTLPLIALLPTAFVVAGLVVALRRRLWGRWGRVYYALFALATITFFLQLNYWNLLGFNL